MRGLIIFNTKPIYINGPGLIAFKNSNEPSFINKNPIDILIIVFFSILNNFIIKKNNPLIIIFNN